MRKVIALFLIFISCFSLFACSEKTYQLAWDGFCYTASDSPMELESNDKKYIIDLLNDGIWENDSLNCDCDFYFVTQKQRIEYHSECGAFNDITSGKVLEVTEAQRLKINSFLGVTDLPNPKTNLEFWITQNVDDIDFSKYEEKVGLFGGKEYYGTGYIPTIDDNAQQVNPEHCVIYTVTSYPDYSDKEQYITHIYITDPTIELYGITLNSSFEEFEYYMKQQGFEIDSSNENHRTAEKGKYSITITSEWIRIRVEVENKYGIIF